MGLEELRSPSQSHELLAVPLWGIEDTLRQRWGLAHGDEKGRCDLIKSHVSKGLLAKEHGTDRAHIRPRGGEGF